MKRKSVRPTALFLALAGAAGVISNAYADWNVAVGSASANGAWSGANPDVWTPSATGATVSATEIGARLNGGTPVVIRTSGGGGAETGDINVNTAASWNASKLTFSAWRNIAIKAGLNGSAAAQLALEYGQGGGGGDYSLGNGAKVSLPAGLNFSTKNGGAVAIDWTVITDLGLEGDATVAPGTMTLQGMNTGLGGNYVLGADIAASGTSTWNDNGSGGFYGFVAVGTLATKFTGNFDGLGHTITGLTINRPGWSAVDANYFLGLFGYATGSLRNVGLLNSSITGAAVIGTLAGRSEGAISNSYADGGSVTASLSGAGGLVGQMDTATSSISNSYANVSVTGTNYACCGGASSSADIGGLVGITLVAGSRISNSYAVGSVHGGTYVGGLAGGNRADIDSSYAAGAVTSTTTADRRGGFIGDPLAGTVTNSYWDSAASGLPNRNGTFHAGGIITSLTDVAAAPNAQASYPGLDFAGSWRIYEGQTRPLLKSFLTPFTVTANNASKTYDGAAYSGGNGVSYSTAPNANLLGAASYGGSSQGAINAGSYVITPSGLYSNQRGYDISYANGTLTITPSYTAASATGTGTVTAGFTGGGAGCSYTVSQFIPLTGHAASPPAGSAPAGVAFPQGLFDFTAGGCTAGSTLSFTITYPQALPAGTQYWKYGPTAVNPAPHWYVLPATIVGNTVTFSITDGGLGDDDLAANGAIVDQGGPGMPGGAAGVPTLSEWAMILMGLLLAGLGAGRMSGRKTRT